MTAAAPFVVAPAIDVLEGRCVRLAGGDRARVTIEGGDPAEAAARFAAGGAPLIHLVDLDGAFGGRPTTGLVARIVDAAGGVPVQVGGGYRTTAALEEALAAGAAHVLVGTAALDPEFLASSAERYGEAFVPALDARDGLVAVAGWTQTSAVSVLDLARACAAVGVGRVLVTSTARDGSLAGPDLPLLRQVLTAGAGLRVLAAGGIAALDDVRRVKAVGCEGVVLGSALWSGRVSLADALSVAAEVPA